MTTIHTAVLALHNILRWVVLILGLLAFVRAARGWLGRREWSAADRKAGMFFSMAMDIQLLLGLLLFFVFSPYTRLALQDFSAIMSNPVRDYAFFTMEHSPVMFIAVILAHLGSILPRRAKDALAKHRRAAIWFGLCLLLILVATPWWRRLFPGL